MPLPDKADGDFTGTVEMAWIREALRQNLLGGRAWTTAVPDDIELPTDDSGAVKPYFILSFATPYASSQGRGIALKEQDQPHVLSFTVTAHASSADDARDALAEASRLLVGETPSNTAAQIRARGGQTWDNRTAEQRPTRFSAAGFYRAGI